MNIRWLLVGVLASIASTAPAKNPLTQTQLLELLQHPQRASADSVRDAARLPAKIMAFAGVGDGDTVLDIYAGGGWYSELFSLAVGSQGRVYAQNDTLTWRFGGEEMAERTKGGRLANLTRLDQVAIADLDLPSEAVDIAFMAINYHDLYFTHRQRNGETLQLREAVVDHRKAFAVVRSALSERGVLIIIDHFAIPGSGYEAANTLHRIDANIVKHQLAEVGFRLVEEAFYLRNPADDRQSVVFDPAIRGKTDRFIYKFVKQ